MPAEDQERAADVPMSPSFKMVYTSIFWITILSLAIPALLTAVAVGFDKPKAVESPLMETCLTVFKMGFGAMVGLIGGKSL